MTENEESNPATSVSPNRKVIKRRKVIKSETYTEGKYLSKLSVNCFQKLSLNLTPFALLCRNSRCGSMGRV